MKKTRAIFAFVACLGLLVAPAACTSPTSPDYDLGSGNYDLGSGNYDLGSGNYDLGSGNYDLGSGN